MATDAAAGLSTDTFDGTELDFWLGDWDARWGAVGRGTNRLTRILGDRVIREEFSGGGANGHLNGLSLSVFDPARRLWRQTWVDDQGGYLDLVGDVVEGCFAFRRDAPEDGPGTRQRMVFRDVAPASFRWTWEISEDAGASWDVRWEIAYTRQGDRFARLITRRSRPTCECDLSPRRVTAERPESRRFGTSGVRQGHDPARATENASHSHARRASHPVEPAVAPP